MSLGLILILRVGWGLKTLKINFRVNLYFNKFDPKKCKKFYTIRDNLGIKANLKIEANFEMKKNWAICLLGAKMVNNFCTKKGSFFKKFL